LPWTRTETEGRIPAGPWESGGGESQFGNARLFTGQHYDSSTGLYYLRNRYYHPELGRFLSRDLLGAFQDAYNRGNPYAYAGNNPTNRVDPSGPDDEEESSSSWESLKKWACKQGLVRFGRLLGAKAVAGALGALLGVWSRISAAAKSSVRHPQDEISCPWVRLHPARERAIRPIPRGGAE
jgi:RHS repeat-associated protein